VTERANRADVFLWHMVDAIAYCADLAEAGKGSPQAIAYARAAAAQMSLIIPRARSNGWRSPRGGRETHVADEVTPLAPEEWRAINRLGIDWSEYKLTRQQLAVLALDGQPFGFTWQDLAAMIATVRAAEVRSQHELADQLRPIRDKITALLAPRTDG
jgi:hypothetical protein